MQIKAVFFDMDGTLLTDKGTVSQSTIRALNALKKKGVLLGLATGRDPAFLRPFMASLGLDVAIAYNGQYLLSRERVLYSQPLDQADVAQVAAFATKHRCSLSFGLARGMGGSSLLSMGTGGWGYRLGRWLPASWAGLVHTCLGWRKRAIHLPEEPVYQMVLMTSTHLVQSLSEELPHLVVTRSNPYTTDIVSPGHSKLSGIRHLAAHYSFSLEEVLVFGDSTNDMEMVEGIPHSVAMKNGTLALRTAAWYVTDSNNHDGIYKALVSLGLIEEEEDGR